LARSASVTFLISVGLTFEVKIIGISATPFFIATSAGSNPSRSAAAEASSPNLTAPLGTSGFFFGPYLKNFF
jgi:hypothetical protein